MASLLMGIKAQTAGQILLDGEDITEYDIDHRAKAGHRLCFPAAAAFQGNDGGEAFVFGSRKAVGRV